MGFGETEWPAETLLSCWCLHPDPQKRLNEEQDEGFQAKAKAQKQGVFEERKGKQCGWCPVNGGGEWRAGVRGEKSYGGRSWPEGPERTDVWWDCPDSKPWTF